MMQTAYNIPEVSDRLYRIPQTKWGSRRRNSDLYV